MSRRTERIGSVIRDIVSEAIQTRLADPRLEPLTSITHVDVSADLSLARVYVSVMAETAGQKLAVTALRNAAGRLRASVADQVRMRQVPRLEFVLDDSVKQSFETVQAIDSAMAELGERPPWETEEAEEQASGDDESAAAGEASAAERPEDEGGPPDALARPEEEDG
jgi:ribosome-binding factor A